MNYDEFLFYTLSQSVGNTKHPLTRLPYDLAFSETHRYYLEFYESNYNSDCISEYDAIINYLKNYK
ncbi:MAG: hypothetical protein GY823_00205 [Flavobacteriaceae bacterium]|nr:hypothetical protein [Flavobacteriaceae bacterium]